ncbi:hypothetical protein DSM106972_017130 [Dulcicalothrix desertica PCC 7102]|uniref:Uncharacterized protein n=1 Tax=Dulcicalothrix desertica PCC 7102 TaxID=232991 RepID=A0A3S1CQL8_9CYAN|nr:hypothetical protein [Dulcicalothrix desertica]RUT08545.1 hypothetical protein DSM106972_017130 [Dulcicalothrix desertica PCC 7102]TWH44024.1 hypothetical protein CAL7102_07793 [Dulcicalothrix desertica PCC 7102]
MRTIQKIMNITLLATVMFSPAAMAQQQSLTTQVDGVSQHVPCRDNKGKIIPCPWQKPIIKTSPRGSSTGTNKKPNPCNPKKGEPVDNKACRYYINGNPKPSTQPKS